MEKTLRSTAIFVIGVAVGSLAIPELSAQVRTLNTTRLITTVSGTSFHVRPAATIGS